MAETRFIQTALATSGNANTAYLTTELNGLVDGGVVLGGEIDNEIYRDQKVKIKVSLASLDMSAQTGPGATIRYLEEIDGEYETNDDAAYGVPFSFSPGTAATAPTKGADLYIDPVKYKLAFVNNTGVTLATGGNSVSYFQLTPSDDA